MTQRSIARIAIRFHNETRTKAMKRFNAAITIICAVTTLSSCNLINQPGSDEPSQSVRILAIEYTEIPPSTTDDAAMIIMSANVNEAGYNHPLRQSATPFGFPTATDPLAQVALRNNRVFVSQGSGAIGGGTTLIGGWDGSAVPQQAGVPCSLFVAASGVTSPVDTGFSGDYQLHFFNPDGIEPNDTLVVGGSSLLQFILESHNTQTTFATGTFTFIARNMRDPGDTRRWGVRGSFTLDDGR
jgi:hypothetical protein